MKKTNFSAFGALIIIFFFWGFVASSNDILIPVFKSALGLEQEQAQLISIAFYIAYTAGSLMYFGISALLKKDLIKIIGYRNGLALGLVISALGTLLFIPAADNASFILLLAGLFTVGIGFALQQIAANPLAINMGDPSTGNLRLSLAGGINNVGTTIGPVLVSFAIFGAAGSGNTSLELSAVKVPYLVLGAAFVAAAVFFKFSKVPDQITSESNENTARISVLSVFRTPQVLLAMIAIFVYVGVEAATASNLPEFMKQKLGTSESEVAPFVSLFWASLMIGRWSSAAGAFGVSNELKQKLSLLLPLMAFAIFMLVNYIAGHNVALFYPYLFLVLVLMLADAFTGGNPVHQLVVYSLLGALSLIVGICAEGIISVFAFIAVGLFCSTLWPCIFTLGIAGLNEKTNIASSLMIMMIMGGGFISQWQASLGNVSGIGIQGSYWLGVVCFIYLIFFAVTVQKILRKQGVSSVVSSNVNH
jgi:FHS family L-fucose permease-like MFS transporter